MQQLVQKRKEENQEVKTSINNLQHYFSLLTKKIVQKQGEFRTLFERLRELGEEAVSAREIVENCASAQRYVLSIVRTLFFIDAEFKKDFTENLKEELTVEMLEEYSDFYEVVEKHGIDLGHFVALNDSQFVKLFDFPNPISKQRRTLIGFRQSVQNRLRSTDGRGGDGRSDAASGDLQSENGSLVFSRKLGAVGQTPDRTSVLKSERNQKNVSFGGKGRSQSIGRGSESGSLADTSSKIVRKPTSFFPPKGSANKSTAKKQSNAFFLSKGPQKTTPQTRRPPSHPKVGSLLAGPGDLEQSNLGSNLRKKAFRLQYSALRNEEVMFLSGQIVAQLFINMLIVDSEKIMLSFVDKFIRIQGLISIAARDYNFYRSLQHVKAEYLKALEKEWQTLQSMRAGDQSPGDGGRLPGQSRLGNDPEMVSPPVDSLNQLACQLKDMIFTKKTAIQNANQTEANLIEAYYYATSVPNLNKMDVQISMILKIVPDKKIKVDAELLKKDMAELKARAVVLARPQTKSKSIQTILEELAEPWRSRAKFVEQESVVFGLFSTEPLVRKFVLPAGGFDCLGFYQSQLDVILHRSRESLDIFSSKLTLLKNFMELCRGINPAKSESAKLGTTIVKNIQQAVNPDSLFKLKTSRARTLAKADSTQELEDDHDHPMNRPPRFLRNNSHDKRIVAAQYKELMAQHSRLKSQRVEKEREKINTSMDKENRGGGYSRDKNAFNFKMLQKLKEGGLTRTNQDPPDTDRRPAS